MSNLTPLHTLRAAMIEANRAYLKSPPEDVHIAHAEYKAARARYNVACGEYVTGLLEDAE
jgi:hypothetical protein